MFKLIPFIFAIALSLTGFNVIADSTPESSSKHTYDVVHQVNINQADVESLSSLKGIGEQKAQAIIEYRTANGHFKTIDDLLEVKGIGEKVLSANVGRITI